jgi:hypothetical protein
MRNILANKKKPKNIIVEYTIMSWLAAAVPFIPDIVEGIGSLFGDKGRRRRRSTRKGQVRKTARRAYVKKVGDKGRKGRKRRLPPRKKNGQFRKVRHRRKRRK